MQGELESILKSGAVEYGLELTGEMTDDFARFGAMLTEKNRVVNLTAISGESDIASLHFLDSLALLTLRCVKNADRGARFIDVGSGAGIPGLPLRIAAPQYNCTLLDSNNKRVSFTREACRALGFDDVTSVHARAEEYARTGGRDAFDFVASRALARLNVLCELCLPLTKPGGFFAAMKGADISDEIDGAKNAIEALGGQLAETVEYVIPHTDIRRSIVVIRKAAATPARYPRRFAKIQREPL
ncbi:MAG: 16S rRNA (guanine(527)-N(7))-methyltransferase RsmG [Oscillospiraceae bacterium]|jgi:16S rRNA (guanine527-N7)-methyltransferase|nr:16S rRNA (guanine(527)-N(7))-methyltransferase RsmG [Oscillospiraceae bacterium]